MNHSDVCRLYEEGLMCSLIYLVHSRLYIIRQLWRLSKPPGRLPRLLVRLQREDYVRDTWFHLPRQYGPLFTDTNVRMINCGWVNNGLVYWGRRESGEHDVEFQWDRCDLADGGANVGSFKLYHCDWCGELK
jgi:hypothetical protein